jgi:DNA-binding NarL/FixJ family response regulator
VNIRIVLADDHQMVREGLRIILGRAPHVEIIGEAASGLEAVECAAKLSPDVIVMDVTMPNLNGIEATRQIKATHSQIKIIGLSGSSNHQCVLRMLEAGAAGYVEKSSASDELVKAIEAVARGKRYFSSGISDMVVDSYVNRVFPSDGEPVSLLGGRERQVLQMLAKGSTSKQIAGTLRLSTRTVETHRRNIMKKLDLHNVAELTIFAIREGFIRLD